MNGGAALEGGGYLGDALYLSLVNLTSLGYGDIVATGDVLRFLGPLETLIGLGLLTASISWILFLYRVLGDYRSLSHEISLLCDTEREERLRVCRRWRLRSRPRVLADLTSRVVTMRDDLVHSPIAYYFHPRETQARSTRAAAEPARRSSTSALRRGKRAGAPISGNHAPSVR